MIAPCPTQAKLKSLSLGQLPEEQSDVMLLHLESCETCQEAISQIDGGEDTFVRQIKSAGAEVAGEFESERGCQVAVTRALAALAIAEDGVSKSGIPNVPNSIGEYDIVKPLGQGGMGHVYLGRHTKLSRPVAIKFIADHRRWDQTMHQRFASEMRLIGGLKHPNIVIAHDAREVDGLAVLVTEYIDGMTLSEILKRTGKLDKADACKIVGEVCKALTYIDSKSLVHRDIKPSNIMIDADGLVKLLDLGLARLQETDETADFTATGQAMGTADYVAPEQVIDSRNVDIRSDIYGLGCTFYKLLSGRAPFADNHSTAFAKMSAHVSETPDSLSGDVPSVLVKLVDKMLHKAPADRPQSPDDVLAQTQKHSGKSDLASLVLKARSIPVRESSLPVKTSTASQPKTARSFFSRYPWSTAIAAAAVAFALGTWLGIVITVKKPDGTTAKVVVPDNAIAIIDDQGNVEIQLPGTDQRTTIPGERVQGVGAAGAPESIAVAVRNTAGNKTNRQQVISDISPKSEEFDSSDSVDVVAVPSASGARPSGREAPQVSAPELDRIRQQRSKIEHERAVKFQQLEDLRSLLETQAEQFFKLQRAVQGIGVAVSHVDENTIIRVQRLVQDGELKPEDAGLDANTAPKDLADPKILRRALLLKEKQLENLRNEKEKTQVKINEVHNILRKLGVKNPNLFRPSIDLAKDENLDETETLPSIRIEGDDVTPDSIVAKLAGKRWDSVTLANAKFSSTLMAKLEQVTSIKSLRLYGEGLSGHIPRLRKVSGLSELHLGSNLRLRDFEALAKLHQLQSLTLPQECTVSVLAAKELAKLTNLESLSLCNTDMDDASFQQLETLVKLRSLDIQHTRITDVGIKTIEKMPELRVLNLIRFDGAQQLTDKAADSICKLSKLESLSMSGEISATGLAKVGELPKLKHLSIVFANVTVHDLNALTGSSITSLSVSSGQLRWWNLNHLKEWKNLKSITVHGQPTDHESEWQLQLPDIAWGFISG